MDLARRNPVLALVLLSIALAGASFGAIAAAPGRAAAGEIVVIQATQDNTMYSEGGGLSNGAGIYLFCGATDQGDKRRALLLFDVAGNVPAGATIVSAALDVAVNKQPAGAPTSSMTLYRSAESWGEAGSDATGNEGQGAAALSGDATWTHRSYNTVIWASPGGDLVFPASDAVAVTGLGPYVFNAGSMVADVQDMLDTPAGNYGWVLVGDETQSRTALRLPSRENVTPQARPQLTVEYEPLVPADAASMGQLKSAYDE